MAGKIIGKFQMHIPVLIEVHIRNKHSLLQSVLISELTYFCSEGFFLHKNLVLISRKYG